MAMDLIQLRQLTRLSSMALPLKGPIIKGPAGKGPGGRLLRVFFAAKKAQTLAAWQRGKGLGLLARKN